MNKNLLFKLISIRLKLMIRGFGNSLPGKKKPKGVAVVFAFLLLYLLAAFEFMFIMLWDSLSVFCMAGLTWLYFALCGLLSLAMSVILNVFTTQTQLYNATDNELLLAMPIPPGSILISRMVILLASTLGTVFLVTAPAVGVYLYRMGSMSLWQVVGILASIIAVTLTAQALTCLLGYLLHLILRRVKNKAMGSMVFTILFLVVYFTLYSKVGDIISYLVTHGETIASAIKVWAAPVYSLGLACSGKVFHSLLLILGSALIFAVAYAILSRTFFSALKGNSSSVGRKKQTAKAKSYRLHSPSDAVMHKELRKLLTCPIYLTNTGLGVIFIVLAAIAFPFVKDKLDPILTVFPGISEYFALFVPAAICLFNGMACFTAPSVSLEGKNLWVMRSLPISGRNVLLGKLKLHLALTGTASTAAGLVLSVTLGCGIAETVLSVILCGLIAALSGLIGMIFNLLLPKFDWLNEAVPCKQGMPVLFVMLFGMGIPVLFGVIYYLLRAMLSPLVYLCILTVLFLLLAVVLYRVVCTWGAKRFESFSC